MAGNALRQTPKGQPIRVGVIGIGHVGRHHARLYREIPDCRLTGVADIDPARLREAAEWGVATYTDYRSLLPKVDAASIAVPTSLHTQVAGECLCGGVDVLVEKPLANNLAEAEGLVDLAAKSGCLLQVGHVERFNGAVRCLHEIVKEPAFIECHRLSPFPARGTDVDVILDLMIHDIDIILSLVRAPVEAISAVGIPVLTDRIDIANARLQFTSGAVANVTASRISMERMRKIRIFQPDTYISLDYASQEVTLHRRLPPAPDAPPPQLPRIVREPVTIDHEEPLRVQLQSFIRCVQERTQPIVSGIEAVEALRVATRILATI